MRAIQERLTFSGPNARYRPHVDGFGVVTSTRECGPTKGNLPRIEIAMIRNATISSIGLSVLAATAFIAAPVSATPIPPDFGQLNYNGSPVAYTQGTGVGNDGYYMNKSSTSAGELLIGVKAMNYKMNGSTLPNFQTSTDPNGGTWLNRDSSGRYVSPSGLNPIYTSWNPNAPAWALAMSVTINGVRPVAATGMMQRLTLTKPGDAIGSVVWSGVDINTLWQINQSPGIWMGVPAVATDYFGANAAYLLGDWKIRLDVYDGSGDLGSQEILVNVVPAPGALALLGVAGLAGARRRRA